MLKPVLVTEPASPLITTAEAKAHLRIDHSDEDTLIDAMVSAATARIDGCEGVLGRALINQTWRQDFAEFDSSMRLPLEPVSSITSITYQDSLDAQQTLASSVYTMLTDERGSYITLNSGQSWPASYFRPDAVSVTFVAGYGSASTDVPQAIIQAALLMVGDWYEHRTTGVFGVRASEVPMAALAVDLVKQYRRTWVA